MRMSVFYNYEAELTLGLIWRSPTLICDGLSWKCFKYAQRDDDVYDFSQHMKYVSYKVDTNT